MSPTQDTTGRIRLLPPEVVDKIAAGEVVERPASVVKELVENALDAEALKVSVAVQGAPDHYLRVLDDGLGMTEDEAHLALKRHATSKLTVAEDLESIRTLGFRGEALPTIARVSRLTLSTCAQGAVGGVQIEIAGGAILQSGPVGRPPGTTVTVAELFFNTPARKKFLQAPRSEMRAITRVVQSYALARPPVHFILSHNGRELLNLPAVEDMQTRASQVFDAQVAGRLVPARYIAEHVEVAGVVGRPDLYRSTRMNQTFLVNGRWVQNPLLSSAVRTAYKNRIPAGRFPVCVLELLMDPRLSDVNVHPTKREIRFSRERQVFAAIVRAVEGALRDVTPELDDRAWQGPSAPPAAAPAAELLPPPRFHTGGEAPPPGPALPSVTAASPPSPVAALDGERLDELVPMWQLHNTYLFCAVKSGLMVIDQHVAHERVLYERALQHLGARQAGSQALLFPETIELPADEVDLLEEAQAGLEKLGFDLRISGPRSVTVHGVPAKLERWERGRFLVDLLETLARERRAGASYTEAVAASYACHAAVRKGDALTLEEMNRLVDDLFACEVPEVCPHGRPVILRLALEEFDRRFGRS